LNMLTKDEIRMLRLQLHLLDIEVSSRQFTDAPSVKNTLPEHSN